MFYEKFLDLCVQRNISPSAAAQEAGFSNAAATDWKNGAKPRKANMKKLANYFNVPVEYFDGDPIAGIEKAPASGTDTGAKYMMELFSQLDGNRQKKAVAYLLTLSQEAEEDKR